MAGSIRPAEHAAARAAAASHVGGAVWDGLVTAVAVFAGLAAFASTPRGLVVALLVLVALATAYDTWWGTGRDLEARIGHQTTVRCAMAGAVAACFAAWGPGRANDWVAALAAVVAAAIILSEPALAKAASYRVTFVSNVPGLAPAPAPVRAEAASVGSGLAALALGAVLAALGVPTWCWLLVVLLAAVPDLLTGLNALARIRASRRIEAGMADAIAAYAPEFVVYTAWPEDGSHQVTMWLPYLRRMHKRFVIVTRQNFPAERLAEHTDAPIVTRYGSRDLDDVVAPSLTTAFYVNASSGNSIFVRYHHLRHVFLGHGDSDKPTSYNPTHAMYDHIFAAGPAAVRRYAAHDVYIPGDKFEIVGRPQVEDIVQADGPVPHASPVVFYAPTWRGHVQETRFHSLPVGESVVQGLLDRGATVIFRPHPFSYTYEDDARTIARIQELLERDAAVTGRVHRWGAPAERDLSVTDCVNASDAMVSDVSSIVSDFLFSGKPFAMMAMSGPVGAFVAEYPVAAAAYVVEGDLSNLAESLDELLGPDSIAEKRLGVRADYLGDFPGHAYADVFVETARRIVDRPRPSAHDVEAERENDEGIGRVTVSAVRRAMADVARDAVAGGLAAVAAGLVIARAPRWSEALVVAVVFLVMVVLHRRARWGNVAFDEVVGSFRPARVLLLLALGVAWSEWYGWSWPLVVAVLVLVFVTAAESAVTRAWQLVGLEARNLPALRTDVPELVPRGVVGVLGIAAVAGVWVLGAARSPRSDVLDSVALAGAVALAVVYAVALGNGALRIFRCVAADENLTGALHEYGPQFAVYFGSTMGAAYQIGMWLPYFERIGRPFVLVMRNLTQMRELEGMTDAPMVHRPTLSGLEDVVVPSLTAAFYVNNATNNTHFIERRQMVHVWLNHGDSEKAACYNPVHAIYDLIFAAGQAGIDRYARHGVEIPARKFEVVGRPQVEDIARAAAPVGEVANQTVLYAPTWRGPYADSEVYSLRQGPQIVQALLDRGVTVVFRSHMFNYRYPDSAHLVDRIAAMLETDRARTHRQHLWGDRAERQMSLPDCFNASDAMVCDVSAVVSDYLQSGKPFSIVSVGRTTGQLYEEAPAAKAAYVIEEDLSNLDDALDDLLGDDPLARERDRARVYYLGDFPEGEYARGFLDASRRLIDVEVRT